MDEIMANNTTFVPCAGDVVYVTSKPPYKYLETSIGTVTKYPSDDRSFNDAIMLVKASDHTSIVLDKIHPESYLCKNMIFRIEDWTFAPVGPEVRRALGLSIPEV